MVTEIWKGIDACQGQYEVSSLGRIRHIKNKKILSQGLTYGYCYPTLSDNGYPKRFRLHRLIAQAFIPNIENKPFVNHKNGIKYDNRAENLEWCTGSENNNHAIKEIGHNPTTPGQRRPITQFNKDGNKIKDYNSTAQAERELGISHQQISNNLKMKQKYCHGFIFKYQEA